MKKYNKLDKSLDKIIGIIKESKTEKVLDSRYFLNMLNESALNVYKGLDCTKKEVVNEKLVAMQPTTPNEVRDILEYVADEKNSSEITRLRILKNMPNEIKESFHKLPKSTKDRLIKIAECSNLITKNDIEEYWYMNSDTINNKLLQ